MATANEILKQLLALYGEDSSTPESTREGLIKIAKSFTGPAKINVDGDAAIEAMWDGMKDAFESEGFQNNREAILEGTAFGKTDLLFFGNVSEKVQSDLIKQGMPNVLAKNHKLLGEAILKHEDLKSAANNILSQSKTVDNDASVITAPAQTKVLSTSKERDDLPVIEAVSVSPLIEECILQDVLYHPDREYNGDYLSDPAIILKNFTEDTNLVAKNSAFTFDDFSKIATTFLKTLNPTLPEEKRFDVSDTPDLGNIKIFFDVLKSVNGDASQPQPNGFQKNIKDSFRAIGIEVKDNLSLVPLIKNIDNVLEFIDNETVDPIRGLGLIPTSNDAKPYSWFALKDKQPASSVSSEELGYEAFIENGFSPEALKIHGVTDEHKTGVNASKNSGSAENETVVKDEQVTAETLSVDEAAFIAQLGVRGLSKALNKQGGYGIRVPKDIKKKGAFDQDENLMLQMLLQALNSPAVLNIIPKDGDNWRYSPGMGGMITDSQSLGKLSSMLTDEQLKTLRTDLSYTDDNGVKHELNLNDVFGALDVLATQDPKDASFQSSMSIHQDFYPDAKMAIIPMSYVQKGVVKWLPDFVEGSTPGAVPLVDVLMREYTGGYGLEAFDIEAFDGVETDGYEWSSSAGRIGLLQDTFSDALEVGASVDDLRQTLKRTTQAFAVLPFGNAAQIEAFNDAVNSGLNAAARHPDDKVKAAEAFSDKYASLIQNMHATLGNPTYNTSPRVDENNNFLVDPSQIDGLETSRSFGVADIYVTYMDQNQGDKFEPVMFQDANGEAYIAGVVGNEFTVSRIPYEAMQAANATTTAGFLTALNDKDDADLTSAILLAQTYGIDVVNDLADRAASATPFYAMHHNTDMVAVEVADVTRAMTASKNAMSAAVTTIENETRDEALKQYEDDRIVVDASGDKTYTDLAKQDMNVHLKGELTTFFTDLDKEVQNPASPYNQIDLFRAAYFDEKKKGDPDLTAGQLTALFLEDYRTEGTINGQGYQEYLEEFAKDNGLDLATDADGVAKKIEADIQKDVQAFFEKIEADAVSPNSQYQKIDFFRAAFADKKRKDAPELTATELAILFVNEFPDEGMINGMNYDEYLADYTEKNVHNYQSSADMQAIVDQAVNTYKNTAAYTQVGVDAFTGVYPHGIAGVTITDRNGVFNAGALPAEYKIEDVVQSYNALNEGKPQPSPLFFKDENGQRFVSFVEAGTQVFTVKQIADSDLARIEERIKELKTSEDQVLGELEVEQKTLLDERNAAEIARQKTRDALSAHRTLMSNTPEGELKDDYAKTLNALDVADREAKALHKEKSVAFEKKTQELFTKRQNLSGSISAKVAAEFPLYKAIKSAYGMDVSQFKSHAKNARELIAVDPDRAPAPRNVVSKGSTKDYYDARAAMNAPDAYLPLGNDLFISLMNKYEAVDADAFKGDAAGLYRAVTEEVRAREAYSNRPTLEIDGNGTITVHVKAQDGSAEKTAYLRDLDDQIQALGKGDKGLLDMQAKLKGFDKVKDDPSQSDRARKEAREKFSQMEKDIRAREDILGVTDLIRHKVDVIKHGVIGIDITDEYLEMAKMNPLPSDVQELWKAQTEFPQMTMIAKRYGQFKQNPVTLFKAVRDRTMEDYAPLNLPGTRTTPARGGANQGRAGVRQTFNGASNGNGRYVYNGPVSNKPKNYGMKLNRKKADAVISDAYHKRISRERTKDLTRKGRELVDQKREMEAELADLKANGEYADTDFQVKAEAWKDEAAEHVADVKELKNDQEEWENLRDKKYEKIQKWKDKYSDNNMDMTESAAILSSSLSNAPNASTVGRTKP